MTVFVIIQDEKILIAIIIDELLRKFRILFFREIDNIYFQLLCD